jgi:hypothetical protein
MKTVKKILKYTFYVFIIIIIITILPILTFHKEPNLNPLQSFYKKGVYHIHSIFSDGKGDIAEITGAASDLKLDFAILTDHGRPNLESARSTGWHHHVLLIGGSEFSLNCGHLAAAGFNIPAYIFPPEPQEAIDEVRRDGGVTFISHPFDSKIPWTDWDVKDFTGLEVLSSYSSARKAGLLKLLLFPLQYLFHHDYALLNTLQYPEENFNKWDELNGWGRFYGIYALDAHAKLPLGKETSLNFPSYAALFNILTVYVKVDKDLDRDPRKAAGTIISALKRGRFFNCIEAITPANGFETFFLTDADEIVEMGGAAPEGSGRIIIKLPFEFATDILIKKDGRIFRKIEENVRKNLDIEVSEPGVYRLEIYAHENKFSDLPWITTNPFFVGKRQNIPVQPAPAPKKIVVNRTDFFKIEKDAESEGSPITDRPDSGERLGGFSFRLPRQPQNRDFWVALARRQQFDFSDYEGVIFEARSEPGARFWLEFRTGADGQQTWYRHSSLAGTQWKTIYIPFDKFHPYSGEEVPPDTSKIFALFFSINNQIAYPGASGTLYLKNIGLY